MTKPLASLLFLAALGVACAQEGQPPATGEPASAQDSTAAGTAGGGAPQSGTVAGAAPSPSAPGAVQPSTPGTGASRPSSASPAAAAVGTPPAPVRSQFREVTIPSGTALSVTLGTPVASDTSKVEDPVRGKLATPIVIDGATVVPAGAVVSGSVTEAVRAGKVKGRASIALRFNTLTARDEKHEIRTARISRTAASTKREDATKVGVGAGAGALIGAIAGGGKGAAIGGAVGAGAGTGVVMATRGDEVELPAGATVSTTLQEPVRVLVPID